MNGTKPKPCGNKECHEWIRSQGYDPEEHPDSVCFECGYSGPFYVYMAQTQNGSEKE